MLCQDDDNLIQLIFVNLFDDHVVIAILELLDQCQTK